MKKNNIEKEVFTEKNINNFVDMKKRKSVKLYIPDINDISDDEIIQLHDSSKRQREELKKQYYSVNRSITKIEKRKITNFLQNIIQSYKNKIELEKIIYAKTSRKLGR